MFLGVDIPKTPCYNTPRKAANIPKDQLRHAPSNTDPMPWLQDYRVKSGLFRNTAPILRRNPQDTYQQTGSPERWQQDPRESPGEQSPDEDAFRSLRRKLVGKIPISADPRRRRILSHRGRLAPVKQVSWGTW